GSFTQTISGALSNARFNQFLAPSLTSTAPQTVTNASTLYVSGAPVAAGNATITNDSALWVASGKVRVSDLASCVSLGTDSLGNFNCGTVGNGPIVENPTSSAQN